MGDYFMMALAFVLVLGPLVVIHEFGHFIVAKYFGIRVEVFSVGFGKRLFGFKRGDTDYRVSLIPLGGYVKMSGENLDEQVTGAPYEFMSKPKWQRFFVAVAGPAVNILFALLIPAVVSMFYFEEEAFRNQPAQIYSVEASSPAAAAGFQSGDTIMKIGDLTNPTWRDVDEYAIVRPGQTVPVTVKRGDQTKDLNLEIKTVDVGSDKIGIHGFIQDKAKITATSIAPGSPAAQAGLAEGDVILSANGQPLEQSRQGVERLIATINNSNGQPVQLTVERNGSEVEITPTPQMMDGKFKIGFAPSPQFDKIVKTKSLTEAIPYSFEENWRMVKLTATAIGQIFEGKRKVGETFSGPVGIAELSSQAVKAGPIVLFSLMALLSLNLGIFNLFPIPVLDGGLIFMLGLEAVLGFFGLPLTIKIKEKMIQVGFVALMLLMGFIIYNDISKKISSKKAPAVQQQVEQPKPAEK
ncbi:MAG: RIP metalloprotease RseP [Acidobacteriota bacterium]